MIARKFMLASNCLVNEQISSLSHRYGNSVLLCDVSVSNALFVTRNFATSLVQCHLSCPIKRHSERIHRSSLTKQRFMFKKFHSAEDPSITFLTCGKSKYFDYRARYGRDKLLHKVIDQLKEDDGDDICVLETSEERRRYADYIVFVSARSTRHLKAMTNHLHQQAKKDFPHKDVIITGEDSENWMIIDFGSVVIHLFLPDVRNKYQLEKLWSLGPEHDEQYQKMLKDDLDADMFRNAKLEDFFVSEESSK